MGSDSEIAKASEQLAVAERAEEATLWDDAAAAYEACLTAIAGTAMAAREPDLLTALGRCYWNMSGTRMAWRTLRRAIALYRERGDGPGMARATLEILRIWGPPERHRAMAEEATEALGDGSPHLRALLLLRSWQVDEAVALAEKHGFEDVLMFKTERDAWTSFDDGRVDEAISVWRKAHEFHVIQRQYQGAAQVLRGAAFGVLQAGLLDRGAALAREAVDYARSVHLRFPEQLALMDLAGEAFARCDFARCEALLHETPAISDFRADLYRMWMAELRGDIPAALSLLVDPERGGGALTAVSQTHAAACGLLFHAGRFDAAQQELIAWADVARKGESFCQEAPVLSDCLATLGSDDLLSEVHDAYEKRPGGSVYAPLQGRGDGDTRGAIALRLELVDLAQERFATGLAWAERERCPLDAARCLLGLARVAVRRGETAGADGYLERASALCEEHGARLYLDQIAALTRA